jgi:hypothetical protein
MSQRDFTLKNMPGVVEHPEHRLLTKYLLVGCIREY